MILIVATPWLLWEASNLSNKKSPAEVIADSLEETIKVVKPLVIEQTRNEVSQSNLRNNSNADKIPSDDGLLDYFNFCRDDYLGDKENDQTGFPLWYQCEGPHYDEFTEKLHQFVDRLSEKSKKSPEWGHRKVPIPAHKSILFFGNSHTRQLAGNLVCQMGSEELLDVYHYEFDLVDPNMAIRFRFRNGASVYIVANSYVAYSHQWQALLERQIQKPIAEFDLVVMGIFNVAKGASSFLDNLQYLASTLPKEYDLDLVSNPPGPAPQNITAVYDGPFLLVSNFSINQMKVYNAYRKMLKASARMDQSFLYQRHYVEIMGEEGAAASKLERKDMVNQDVADNAVRLHRCIGKRGGYPDLVAWDVIEFLHEHSAKSSNPIPDS